MNSTLCQCHRQAQSDLLVWLAAVIGLLLWSAAKAYDLKQGKESLPDRRKPGREDCL
jgi:hypothetical protein